MEFDSELEGTVYGTNKISDGDIFSGLVGRDVSSNHVLWYELVPVFPDEVFFSRISLQVSFNASPIQTSNPRLA